MYYLVFSCFRDVWSLCYCLFVLVPLIFHFVRSLHYVRQWLGSICWTKIISCCVVRWLFSQYNVEWYLVLQFKFKTQWHLWQNITYNFSKQYNILSTYYKNAARNIAIFLPDVNSFNCSMKNKISWNENNTIIIQLPT